MPFRAGIRLTGVQETLRAITGARVVDGYRVARGMAEVADLVYQYADILVPKDTRDLQKSGRVVNPDPLVLGFAAQSTVSYGGLTAPYAWIVHEDLSVRHAPPTQAKYLSHAVELARVEASQIIRRNFASGETPYVRGD